MRALVIEHDHTTPCGLVGERLVERGYELIMHRVVPADRYEHPDVPGAFPSLEGIDLLVAMGAPWSVYDVDRIGSWLVPELELLRDAVASGVPVLGVCFGGQALAAALGGTVSRSPSPELGWVSVESVRLDLVPTGPWFQWHVDRWQLPPGAEEVARSDAASQAFVYRGCLAVQFHPELTEAMLRGWLDNGGSAEAAAAGVDVAAVLAQTRRLEPAAHRRASALVDAFLKQVAPAAGARFPIGRLPRGQLATDRNGPSAS